MPSNETDAWRRRRARNRIVETVAFDALAPERRDPLQVVDGVDASGVDELVLRAIERLRVGVARRHEHARGRQRDVAGLERAARGRHVREPPREVRLPTRGSPRDPEPGGEPRRGQETAVSFEEPAPFDLREASQPFELEQLADLLELGEVLLDADVGEVGERLRSERFDGGAQLAQATRS
jgi:hypothetical protein